MDYIPDGPLVSTSATVCEANLYAWVPVFGTLGAVVTDNPPGVYRAVTPYRSPLFNSVVGARLAPETVDSAIEQVKADARARRISILWWIGPSSKPADLAERLLQHGFVVDGEAPGMTIDLGQMNESLPAPPGLSIERAQDDTGRRRWVEAMYGGFDSPVRSTDEMTADPWYILLGRVPADRLQAFTACLGGRPVAVSLLLPAAGVAGIWVVATIPEARRQGIGAAITRHALRQGRAMGYTTGVLQASAMGAPVYRSLGFRECGCTFHLYRWKPEET